jgi:superfamily I DNA/RNA helicase
MLAERDTTVVVIGDAEQSIFGFAGARPEHFRDFALLDIDAYAIADNRRSTDRIITLLNDVRNDGVTQHGVQGLEGSPIVLLVGSAAVAVQHANTIIPAGNALLVIGATRLRSEAHNTPALHRRSRNGILWNKQTVGETLPATTSCWPRPVSRTTL